MINDSDVNKGYQVLIIGAGNIACGYDEPASSMVLTHAHAIMKSEHFHLAGFYDTNYDRAESAAAKWGTRAVADLDQMKEKPDIICCAAPDDFHYDILKKFSSSWVKAVICEKPIAKTSIQARELADAYYRKGIPLFVNYTRRFLDEYADLKDWIRQAGELITGNCFYGKGILHNCSHMINILEFLFGDLELICTGDIVYDNTEEDPSIEFQLKAGTGKLFFHPIPCSIVTVFEFDLFFSGGRVKYSDAEGVITYYKVGTSPVFNGELNYVPATSVRVEQSKALIHLYQNVYEVLKARAGIYSSGNDACRTVCLCERIRKKAMERDNGASESDCNN